MVLVAVAVLMMIIVICVGSNSLFVVRPDLCCNCDCHAPTAAMAFDVYDARRNNIDVSIAGWWLGEGQDRCRPCQQESKCGKALN